MTKEQREKVVALIERLEKNELVSSFYVKEVDGKKCYCAVGHAMVLAGISVDDLEHRVNYCTILPNRMVENAKHINTINQLRQKLVEYFGIQDLAWRVIQELNDDNDKKGVIQYLKKLIA